MGLNIRHLVVSAVLAVIGLPLGVDAGNIIVHVMDKRDPERMKAAENVSALLETAGHTVTISDAYAKRKLTDKDRAALAQFDLMIFPRWARSTSKDWDDAYGWPTVDVPVLISNGFIANEWGMGSRDQYKRSGSTVSGRPSRLHLYEDGGADFPHLGDADHPLFQGITFDANGNIPIGADPSWKTNSLHPVRVSESGGILVLTAGYGARVSDDPSLASVAIWEAGTFEGITTRRGFLELHREDELSTGDDANLNILSDNMKRLYLNMVEWTMDRGAAAPAGE